MSGKRVLAIIAILDVLVGVPSFFYFDSFIVASWMISIANICLSVFNIAAISSKTLSRLFDKLYGESS